MLLLLLQSLVPSASTMLRSISVVVLTITLFATVVNACDQSCLCKKAGGEWRPGVAQWLKPACRIYYSHQGVHPAGPIACLLGGAAALHRGPLEAVPDRHTLAPFLLLLTGRKRWAHVYLPSSYDGSKQFPVWFHLHGVFWNTMDNISQKVC